MKKIFSGYLPKKRPISASTCLKKGPKRIICAAIACGELAGAEQIFRVLIQDTEISVREALADTLKDNPNVPRDIIISLTRDVDSVALPIIEYSDVLTDDDLIGLIQMAKTSGRPVAVASRREVSQAVADVVLETQNIRAVTQLIKTPRRRFQKKPIRLSCAIIAVTRTS